MFLQRKFFFFSKKKELKVSSKRGLYIIDLEHPQHPLQQTSHLTKWEVMDVQWNPHISKSEWIASTSNQKVFIWNIEKSSKSNPVAFILSGHQRAVSDLNWHPFHPELLATCSYDTYIHLWDLRVSTEKPSHSFCTWTAGASQVKWNRLNEWLLASTHDTDARVWDMRKGSSAMTLITAHMKKMYGLDWSRIHEREFVTCSQDGLVKVILLFLKKVKKK